MLFGIGQSKIGYLSLDVLVSESLSLPSEVTKYPVEDGNEDISDHITAGNEELTITGAIASGSIFGIEFGSRCYSKMTDAVDQLRTMHKERKTFTIVTGLGKYEEMAFTNLTLDRSNSPQTGGQWLSINATLRKIRKVSLKSADLPEDKIDGDGKGKGGKTESKGGKSGDSNKPPSEPTSIVRIGGDKGYLPKGHLPSYVGEKVGP